MKTRFLTLCLAFLMLVAARALAQDTVCAMFDTEEQQCNNPPYSRCSSRARYPGVIIGAARTLAVITP